MLSLNHISKNICFWGIILFFSASALAQPSLVRQGSEQPIFNQLKADHVNAALALSPSVMYVTWDDNAIDGKNMGQGIGLAQLDADSFAAGKIAHVNKSAVGNQDHPQIQKLNNGNYLIVWQGSPSGSPSIYARVYKQNHTFASSIDVRLNTYTKDQQVNPVVTALQDGGALVAWSSYGEDGDMMGVYARKVSAAGTCSAKEFQVNQVTAYNQRNPAVATLKNGNFVVVWISEQESSFGSVDVFGRVYSPKCVPVTGEFRINRSKDKCADPSIASLPDGGFTVVWSQHDGSVATNGWDIVGSAFGPSGQAKTPPFLINTFLYGDQYRPEIAAGSVGCMVVWTSLGEDGDREGVFGRFLLNGSKPVGSELQVNTTTISQQLLPTVAWNGVDRFLVVWSSPIIDYGFNLFGQAFILNQ